jgi:DamX protein
MNPFNPDPLQADFSWPERDKYLEMLLHFCHYSQSLVLVTGEQASGKTTLLRRLRSELSQDVLCKMISASANIEADVLFNTLLQAYHLPFISLAQGITQQQIHTVLANIESNEQTCLLLIDEAECLPEDSLRLLVQLISQQNPHETYLHVILFGKPELTQRCFASAKEYEAESFVQVLPLTPLSLEETKDYLHYCYQHAGLAEEVPWDNSEIEQIHVQAEGLIGKIQELAKNHLQQSTEEEVNMPEATPNYWQQHRTKIIGAGVSVVVLVSALLLMSQEPSDQPTEALVRPIQLGQAATPTPTPAGAEPSPLTAAANNANLNDAAPAVADNAATPPGTFKDAPVPSAPPADGQAALTPSTPNAAASTPASGTDSSAVATNEVAPTSPGAEPLKLAQAGSEDNAVVSDAPNPSDNLIASAATKGGTDVGPVTTPSKSKATKTAKAPKPAKNTGKNAKAKKPAATSASSKSPKKTASGKGYTLQLLSTHQEKTVQQFIKTNHLQGKAQIHKTARNGKTWYVVTYGQYATSTAAQQDVNALPASVQKLHPWPKRSA